MQVTPLLKKGDVLITFICRFSGLQQIWKFWLPNHFSFEGQINQINKIYRIAVKQLALESCESRLKGFHPQVGLIFTLKSLYSMHEKGKKQSAPQMPKHRWDEPPQCTPSENQPRHWTLAQRWGILPLLLEKLDRSSCKSWSPVDGFPCKSLTVDSSTCHRRKARESLGPGFLLAPFSEAPVRSRNALTRTLVEWKACARSLHDAV